MKKTSLILSIAIISTIKPAVANTEVTPWQAKVNAYTTGLPEDVVSFIGRLDGCAHWGGEEPTNEKREKEITEAMTKLKCDNIDDDRAKLNKKYKKQPKVIKKLKDFPAALG